MKYYFIISFLLLLGACQGAKEESEKKLPTASIENVAKDMATADIGGKWKVVKVSGGPVVIYPGGRKSPAVTLDFNRVWSGAVFEFAHGIGFLSIPGAQQDEIGNYKLAGDKIIFDGHHNAEQKASYERNGNTLIISFTPEMYRSTLANNGGSGIETDISSSIVFHLIKI